MDDLLITEDGRRHQWIAGQWVPEDLLVEHDLPKAPIERPRFRQFLMVLGAAVIGSFIYNVCLKEDDFTKMLRETRQRYEQQQQDKRYKEMMDNAYRQTPEYQLEQIGRDIRAIKDKFNL